MSTVIWHERHNADCWSCRGNPHGAYGCNQDFILERTRLSSAGSFPATVEHVIQDMQKRMKEFKPGDMVQTDKFEMMYKKFTLNIYPNGRKEEDRGHVSLYLEYHPHWYKSIESIATATSLKVTTRASEEEWDQATTTKAGVISKDTEIKFHSKKTWGFPKWLSHEACKKSLENGSFKIKIEMEVLKDETSWSFPNFSEVLPKKRQARYLVYLLYVLFWLAFWSATVKSMMMVADRERLHRIPPLPPLSPYTNATIWAFMYLVFSIPALVIVLIFLYIIEVGRRWYTARVHSVQDEDERCALLDKKVKKKNDYNLV